MHNFPKNINVICKTKYTKKQVLEIFQLAIKNGLVISESIQKELIDKAYPYFLWDGEEHESLRYCNAEHFTDNRLIVTFEEFKAFVQGKGKYTSPFEQTLSLNSEYKATVTKAEVKVGCQIFSHDIVKNLYEISQKAQKSEF